MPLERFIPLSPDPNITTSSDMGMAQFGHLNTIVDYLNGTNALTDIKIAGDNNTPGYIDFSSNPIGSTTIVGAIRTYVNETTLSEVLQFREDGTIFGQGTQAASNLVIQKDITNDLIIYSSASWGGLLTPPTAGGANTMLNGRITGTHGGYGNVAVGLGTVQADGSAYNFNVAMGQGSFARGINCTAIGQGTSAGNSTNVPSNATAIGVGAIALSSNAFALGNVSALLQIGGNFVPTARVHIKGLGSTSATTSLLVQNSSSNTALEVLDDLTTNFLGRIKIQYDTISFLGNPSNTYIQQLIGTGIGSYSSATSTQLCVNAQPKLIISDTGASRASTLIVGHLVTSSAMADPSALLEVRSDALYLKGFLKPRMTTTQKNAIVTPAAGLEVFDTTLGRPCFYSGSAWVTL